MASRPVYASDASIQTHLRNIKLHNGVSFESLSEAASTEVDGMLGLRYKMPAILDPNDPDERATAYWLQNATSMIAAGRYMLSTAAPGSQDTVNNYGRYLVSNAKTMIDTVINGKIDLVGLEEILEDDSDKVITGATILNQDAYSQVDLFYDNQYPQGFTPDRLPRALGMPWPR